MAVSAFGGFSIREYAAEIRKADASKCWPFGGDLRESLLPPIECRRYRWWESELQIARSALGTEGEPDAGVDGGEEDRAGKSTGSDGAGADVTPAGALALPLEISAAEDEEEGRIRSVEKPKARTPKKRSILELFAVAPLIDAGGDEDQRKPITTEISSPKEDDDDEESDWCRLETQKRRKKEGTKERMRKRTKGNSVKKTKAKDEKTAKKRENKKRRFQIKHQKRKNKLPDGLPKEEETTRPSKQSPAPVPSVPCDSTITDISGKTKNADLVIQQPDKPEKENTAPKGSYSKSCVLPEDTNYCERNASPSLMKTDTALASAEKVVGLKGEKKRTGLREELMLTSPGSTHMQNLCRVFSDVLTAASAVHSSSEANDQVVTEKLICCGPPLLSPQPVDVRSEATHKAGSHNERFTGGIDMVDLNDPADFCTSPVEGLKEFSKGRAETYPVFTGRSEGPSITSVVALPLSSPRNLNSGSASSSAVTIKRKTVPQERLNENAFPCSPTDGMMSSIYNSWLTRKLPQKVAIPPSMYFERSVNGDVITGLPLDSQGELSNRKLSKQERPEYLFSGREQPNSPPVNIVQVHNFIERGSLDLQNQLTSSSQISQEPQGKYGPRVGSRVAPEIPSRASFCSHNEPQLPTMRLMGTNVTLGKSNTEQRGSSGVKSCVDQRSISFRDPYIRTPGSYLQQGLLQNRVAQEASQHHSHEIKDYPSTSKPYYLDMDTRAGDSLFGGGSTNPFGNLPVYLTQAHGQKALLRNQAIGMGVPAPLNMHQNLVLNSGSWKYDESIANYWSHLKFPSDPPSSESFTHWLVKDGNPMSSDMNFSGFPMSRFSARSTHTLNSKPAAKLTSLAGNLSKKMGQNSSSFEGDGLVIQRKVGEQLPIRGKNVVRKALDVNRTANEDSSRSRPVKLCAGAKHILKPSLAIVDHDKPLAVHSTVPFVSEKGSSKVPIPHDKARIYQL